ncbi:hypothetical protein HXX76_004795 [Chlamydomonas incerta]|uniref:SET domain-containing protein n=1 Tax=Chlamydomonas incerta TaxID=51695 RepID=A0A835W6X4_CHLIN|nr:hypothetical protein HXX76_004795 [Chlamydomonas incerta]|eukprot:KAG2439439.1 hypothetical protein HXX76_004795 [Chlamydomonas incerta]
MFPALRATRPTVVRAAAAAAAAPAPASSPSLNGSELDAGSAVLQWACQGWEGPGLDDDEEGFNSRSSRSGVEAQLPLAVGVRDLGEGRGRGLVALRDVGPEETLLSVSMDRVFCSEPDSELHWSADMGLRLLKARHASRQQAQQPALQQSRSGGAVDWGVWIRSLPTAVRTPLEYGDAELGALDEYMAAEVVGMQQCVQDCFEVVRPELDAIGCGWEDFLWAVQVFHSRCFFEPTSGRHMTVPGVDMANHTATPSAGVRIVHPMSQGWDATAEIAEPPPPEPSRFTLVAGEAGIRCGEEVTISYGSWPSEAFLLLFGFVPSPCPGEALTLFRDAEEVVRWCMGRHGGGPASEHQDDEEVEARVAAALEQVAEALAPPLAADDGGAAGVDLGDFTNLVVTPQGVDGRLEPLLAVLEVQVQGEAAAVPAPITTVARQLLVARLRERAAEFAVDGTGGQGCREPPVVAFRESKRAVAAAALAALTGPAR